MSHPSVYGRDDLEGLHQRQHFIQQELRKLDLKLGEPHIKLHQHEHQLLKLSRKHPKRPEDNVEMARLADAIAQIRHETEPMSQRIAELREELHHVNQAIQNGGYIRIQRSKRFYERELKRLENQHEELQEKLRDGHHLSAEEKQHYDQLPARIESVKRYLAKSNEMIEQGGYNHRTFDVPGIGRRAHPTLPEFKTQGPHPNRKRDRARSLLGLDRRSSNGGN
ncbi:hypothetical protein ACM66B_001248 [Microbotryomycetes sp. NB124-2]